MPLLVAASTVDAAIIARLRRLLLDLGSQPSYKPLLAEVLLSRFVLPDVVSYRKLEAMARAASENGYETIQ